MPEKNMSAVGDIVSGHNGRKLLRQNGRLRTATPLAYIENCASRDEVDFLQRYFEAYCFTTGSRAVDSDGAPIGRYADYAEEIDPEGYVRLEIHAFQWVRRYELGAEWAMMSELFLRMEAERSTVAMIDFGGYRVNSLDEKISLGAGQASMRDLGIRLKDAYRNFFRWYTYVQQCEAVGREPTPDGALKETEREQAITQKIEQFKLAKGLNKANPTV
jgi:hypothetical protein